MYMYLDNLSLTVKNGKLNIMSFSIICVGH